MGAIKINIPKGVADLLGNTPEEVKQSVHEIIVLSSYSRHDISSVRAAELLDMDLPAFVKWSSERGVPSHDVTAEALQQELRTLDAMDRPDSRS